jgi:hypothetical protein
MTYCSDCGVYYTGAEDICPNCGNSFSQNGKSEIKPFSAENEAEKNMNLNDEKKNLFPGPVDTNNQEPDEIQNNSMRSEDCKSEVVYLHDESQLGKGIIKPQKVEMAVDGVHFKYETPPHSFMKEGPIKGKPKEYRVTSADMELKSISEDNPEKTLQEEPSGLQITKLEKDQPNTDQQIVSQEPTMQPFLERDGEPEEQMPNDLKEIETPATDEDKSEELIEKSVIKELIPEPVIPEPELPDTFDTAMGDDAAIWEGAQSWYKIPIGNQYRVTRHSLMIFDRYRYKLLDVSLSLITEISVKQSWVGKLMGVGDLLISIPDFAAAKVVLGGVSEPYQVKKLMEERMKDLN